MTVTIDPELLEPFPLPTTISVYSHRIPMSEALTLDEYQRGAAATAIYPDEARYVYPTLGVAGEAGEVVEKVLKGLFPVGPPKEWDDKSCVVRDVYRALAEFVKAAAECERLKKVVRDKGGTLPAGVLQDLDDRAKLFELHMDPVEVKKELGGLAWYLADLSRRFGFLLSEVGAANLAQLKSRQERGVLSGSGDNR